LGLQHWSKCRRRMLKNGPKQTPFWHPSGPVL
jgi:hypothetical protein